MEPRQLGKIDNHKQEPWKAPLPEFIEKLYWKRFKKERPDDVRPIEEPVSRTQNLRPNLAPGGRGTEDRRPEQPSGSDGRAGEKQLSLPF
jgi:hypothetical protein